MTEQHCALARQALCDRAELDFVSLVNIAPDRLHHCCGGLFAMLRARAVGTCHGGDPERAAQNGHHALRAIPLGGCSHRALLLGIALLLTIAVALGGCTSMQESAHRSADHVAGEGAVYTSGAVLPNVDEPVLSGFVAFGDSGGGPAQLPIARAIGRWVAASHRVDALITTGDNVYDDGDPQQYDAQLDRPYRALRRTRPLQ